MHKGARTDLCGGRGVTRVPTATRNANHLTDGSPTVAYLIHLTQEFSSACDTKWCADRAKLRCYLLIDAERC